MKHLYYDSLSFQFLGFGLGFFRIRLGTPLETCVSLVIEIERL
jgi:hypothetical protein